MDPATRSACAATAPTPSDSWSRASFVAFAALSVAVSAANGHFAYGGLLALGASIACFAWMARSVARERGGRDCVEEEHAATLRTDVSTRNEPLAAVGATDAAEAGRGSAVLVAACVCIALGAEPPGIYLDSPLWCVPHWALLVAMFGAVFALFGERATSRARRRWALVTFLGAAFAQKGLVLFASPSPTIDVFAMLQGGADALLRGESPYTALYPNPYAPGAMLDVYVYPPLTVLATTPARLLLGDVRWTMFACEVVSTWLLWRMESGAPVRVGAARWACLYAVRPRGAFVLEQSWTEPLSVALILGVFLAARARRHLWAGVLVGLVLASKQYLVALGPLLLLGLARASSSRLLRTLWTSLLAALVAAAVTLPLALVVWDDFVHDVIRFHLDSPARPDALNLTALLARWGVTVPAAVSLGAGVAAAVVFARLAWRARGQPWALAFCAAATLLASLLLQKHAFCNYYDLVAALLAASGALRAYASRYSSG